MQALRTCTVDFEMAFLICLQDMQLQVGAVLILSSLRRYEGIPRVRRV